MCGTRCALNAINMTFAFILSLVCHAGVSLSTTQFKSGDIILHESLSQMAPIIKKVSRSRYTHVGIIEVAADGIFVIEAISKVSRTPLKQFVARGKNKEFTLLRHPGLTLALEEKLMSYAKKQLKKPYDHQFQLDNEKLYCSELVYKAFAQVDLNVGALEGARDLNVGIEELAIATIHGIDWNTKLITPASLAKDTRFEPIGEWTTLAP
jgi:hypothetical protein